MFIVSRLVVQELVGTSGRNHYD